jgi:hypothetical protein
MILGVIAVTMAMLGISVALEDPPGQVLAIMFLRRVMLRVKQHRAPEPTLLISLQDSGGDQVQLELLAPAVAHDGDADRITDNALDEKVTECCAAEHAVISDSDDPITGEQTYPGSRAPRHEAGDHRAFAVVGEVDPDDAALLFGRSFLRHGSIGDVDDPQDLCTLRRLGGLLRGDGRAGEEERGGC